MDPSDQDRDPVLQALATQGVRVGHHEQILKQVTERLCELSVNVTQLSAQMNQLAQLSTMLHLPPAGQPQAADQPPVQPPTSAAREPHIPTPERYSGDLGSCGQFLLQCSLVFDQQPNTYHTDKSRISFLISLLTGRAAQWATAVWESDSTLCQSCVNFTSEMRKIFDHPLKGKEAAKRLLSLSQGSSSVAQYAIDFRILAVESGWDDTALQGVFMRGLSERVKDELAACDETNSLEELISLATRLDNRLRDKERNAPESSTGEEPMQLGRARLTPAERQRRQRSGLCIYCGQAGHYINSCPQRPKEMAHQLQLPSTLCWSRESIPLLALVDSGADDNFIDSNFVSQANIPLDPLKPPRDVNALNGERLARITHGLNDITVKNKYPLPLIDSAFEPLHQATIFTKLDLRNAYHLVRIRQGDEWKTAFNTPLGHFEYLVMPFGLTNAPAVFQTLVNDVLRDMLNKFVFVYLDDILIFSRDLKEHVQHVRLVLQRLLENKLFVKAEKCEFHATSVNFLGFVIQQGQIKADPEKVKAVAEWPRPETRKQLQRFLGFANFYRRFIKDYSRKAAPLTRLTSTLTPFKWSSEAEDAFATLKSLFTSAPVLTHPDPSRQFIVEVDASDSGVGAVLSQRSTGDQRIHPCAFFSHRLSPAEVNYDIGNGELLAVVLALQEWRHWLEGAEHPFIVWTDHKNLSYLRSAKRLNSRQARWALFLGRFNFVLTYRPGSRNIKPDSLSRQFSPDVSESLPEPILPATCVIDSPANSSEVAPSTSLVASIHWEIERVVREAQQNQPAPDNCPPNSLFVPESVRAQVLQWGHSSKLTCHPGFHRTLAFLKHRDSGGRL
ncbi:uncharacterized protein LOC129410863 [Boleophthalmus pectinirostris]|uniref:uncharacterized protein LOC129410863 n=1 Tax=Boleophthalmus pectinirostris TaxID=150288 RepID=UPI002432E9B9|nr:uncharacterized protein LOC129410863 [Boleophthalmus pectinirostris]